MSQDYSKAKLATKAGIDDFIENIDFDDKLKNANKKVTPNKTKHVLIENELNELSEKSWTSINKRINKRLDF